MGDLPSGHLLGAKCHSLPFGSAAGHFKKAEGSILEFETDNLCETCRVAHKCAKLINIVRVVETLEITALDNWGIDVDVFFNINDCPQYRMPFDNEVNGV